MKLFLGLLVIASAVAGPAGFAMASNGGDGYNLSVGVLLSREALIAQSLQMPAVQTAVAVFQSRGYVRVPEGDVGAQTVSTYGPNGSSVVLAFSKPGASSSSDTLIAPVIVISTWQPIPEGEVATVVDGALMTMVRDPVTDTWYFYSAEYSPVTIYAESDPSFTVPSDPEEYQYSTTVYESPVMESFPGVKKAMKFAACVGWSNVGAVSLCVATNCGPAMGAGCVANPALCVAGAVGFEIATAVLCAISTF